MNRKITFRHMDHLPVLEEFANKYIDKIEKFISSQKEPIFLELTLEAAHTHAHNQVEILLKTPDFDLAAHHEGPDIYKEIEIVVDKLIAEIKKAKDKKIDQRHKDNQFRIIK